MKFFARLVLLLFLTIANSLSADAFRVSLINSCENGPCEPRKWYITDSYDPAFLSLQSPPVDSNGSWKEVSKFPIWVNEHFQHNSSVHTYTFLTFFDLPAGAVFNDQPGIRFPEIGEVFEVYINGTLIAHEGEINGEKVTYHRTIRGVTYKFNDNILKPTGNSVLVKISGDPHYDHTGFYLQKGYDVGIFEILRHEEQDRVTLVLLSIYIVVGLYHIFLYYRRRVEKYNFFYGTLAVGLGIYLYTRTAIVFENPVDSAIVQRVELVILYGFVCSFLLMLDELFFDKAKKTSKYFGYYSIGLSVLTLFPPMYIAEYILRLWHISIVTIFIPLTIYRVYTALKENIPNARRLLYGIILITFSSIFDILDSAFLHTGLSFSKYTFFIVVLGFATVLANKFITVHNELEDLTESLEKKVDERTRELSETLKQVNTLKQQQDGDYYLTSLLLTPLGVNQAASNDNIQIQFLVKQKKQFTFKHYKSEIGGDLCRSESIVLKGRHYTVFFNADAMGKSMQGAGGAIVMGAVFDSIIERTSLSSEMMDQFPEKWLKNAFVELHKVFESFDCTMLVSVVLGIIDDATGLLFFLNAEHPYPVLYRDGQASFIGEDSIYRKLGTPISRKTYISVDTFQLKKGDILICGSDGRDDVMIEEDGVKVLNQDEKRFLWIVQESGASLEKIYESLVTHSQLTDDLSLVKVSILNNNLDIPEALLDELISRTYTIKAHTHTPKIEEIENELKAANKAVKLDLLKLYGITYFYHGNYQVAIRFLKEYTDTIPGDTEVIYYLSCSYKFNLDYENAIETGERVRIRKPTNVKNLVNLAECYLIIGNITRAKFLSDESIFMDEQNEDALLLAERIHEKLYRI